MILCFLTVYITVHKERTVGAQKKPWKVSSKADLSIYILSITLQRHIFLIPLPN
jgi:hypothetical protein